MKLIAVGVGTCFSGLDRGNSNFLLEEDGEYFAIDFGLSAIYLIRDEMKIPLSKISALTLSHQHVDHQAGVAAFAFHKYYIPNENGQIEKPTFYLASDLVHPIWDNLLKSDLQCVQGKILTLKDYFNVISIPKNKSFQWKSAKITMFQVQHVVSGHYIKPSYGFIIENINTGFKTMISGDCIFNPDGMDYLYHLSDLILHDCEVSEVRSRVHPSIIDLRTLDSEIKSKMWLYHTAHDNVDVNGFKGLVKKGQTFNI